MSQEKVSIAIVNSSSFGVSFPEHLRELERFARLIRVEIGKEASLAEFHAKLALADGLIASVTPTFGRDVLRGLPNLRVLARHGVGCDNVDLNTCTELGIVVAKVGPLIERESVAQMAVALMGAAARQIMAGAEMVRASQWAKRATIPLGVDFNGETIGLVGLGAIGGTVARILTLGYQAKVIACDPYLSTEEIATRHATKVSLPELLARSRIISLHCPLTEETLRLFRGKEIETMNDGTLLVNTCRGELFDQAALIAALDSGKLGAYATDVVEGEPILGDHPLLQARNVIVTPHLGGYSLVSLRGMGRTMVDDMKRVFVAQRFPGVIANEDVDLPTSRIARFWSAR